MTLKLKQHYLNTIAQRSKQLLTLIKHIKDWSIMVDDLSTKVYRNPSYAHARALNLIQKQMVKSIEDLGIDYQELLKEPK